MQSTAWAETRTTTQSGSGRGKKTHTIRDSAAAAMSLQRAPSTHMLHDPRRRLARRRTRGKAPPAHSGTRGNGDWFIVLSPRMRRHNTGEYNCLYDIGSMAACRSASRGA